MYAIRSYYRLLVGPGSAVDVGSPLAVIASAEVGTVRSSLQAASARARTAEASYKREKELYERGMSALREFQAARNNFV